MWKLVKDISPIQLVMYSTSLFHKQFTSSTDLLKVYLAGPRGFGWQWTLSSLNVESRKIRTNNKTKLKFLLDNIVEFFLQILIFIISIFRQNSCRSIRVRRFKQLNKVKFSFWIWIFFLIGQIIVWCGSLIFLTTKLVSYQLTNSAWSFAIAPQARLFYLT